MAELNDSYDSLKRALFWSHWTDGVLGVDDCRSSSDHLGKRPHHPCGRAPIVFVFISVVYFTTLNYTTPLITAFIFVAIVVLMDFFIVSLLINKNFDMFRSPIGTWIPFALIFISTYLTGTLVTQ